MARKRIGELLLGRGAITPAQLEAGLAEQRVRRQRLGAVLIAQGAITDATLAQVLSEALGLPAAQLSEVQPEWSAIHMLRARFCEQHDLFPYALETLRGRRHLLVAMSDPLNVPALEEIEFTTGLKVAAHVAPLSEVRQAILRYYHKVGPDSAAGAGQVVGPGGAPLQVGSGELPTLDVAEVVHGDEEPAVIVGEALPAGEITERNALAALIERREAQRRAAREAQRPAADLRPGAAAPARPVPAAASSAKGLGADLAYLLGEAGAARETSDVEELERKFWALMRIMARKGLLTREEFSRELDDAEGPAAAPAPPPLPPAGRVR
ncbi:general secretion pathway protein GspE [Aggregicoccus sp. 17bor-14]|uniref:GspE/PulE/PilB domain-containing protein n=1 Tax=Myxococcaceae TaxID=31 RepID=UPI00129CDA35|nr:MULTISPECIES: general secretion pathway protein GspE [Myxococcaceae]MBF5046102.1 general secretion pathway protein GspE [Simulacricoccus sp. 17bor-14]MRI91830.1 general secretion pathway protein GspE [Aggregicoccus sp. 17bor-14]